MECPYNGLCATTQHLYHRGARDAWEGRSNLGFSLIMQLWLHNHLRSSLLVQSLIWPGNSPQKCWWGRRHQAGLLSLACISVSGTSLHLPITHPLHSTGNLCPRNETVFLLLYGNPSYTPGLQTSWPVVVKVSFSYIMIETLWSETSRHFFNLEILRQLGAKDWWGWKYIILISQKHWPVTYFWVLCSQN